MVVPGRPLRWSWIKGGQGAASSPDGLRGPGRTAACGCAARAWAQRLPPRCLQGSTRVGRALGCDPRVMRGSHPTAAPVVCGASVCCCSHSRTHCALSTYLAGGAASTAMGRVPWCQASPPPFQPTRPRPPPPPSCGRAPCCCSAAALAPVAVAAARASKHSTAPAAAALALIFVHSLPYNHHLEPRGVCWAGG